MLRSEPIIGYERRSASARGDVADEVLVRTGGPQVEPAAVEVKDRRALSRPRRFRPQAGDPSDGIGCDGHVRGSRDALHDGVERTAGSRSCELAFEGCDARSESGRAEGILRAERMDSQPRRFRGHVTHRSEEHTSELQSRLHLVCRLLLEKKKKPFKMTNILC